MVAVSSLPSGGIVSTDSCGGGAGSAGAIVLLLAISSTWRTQWDAGGEITPTHPTSTHQRLRTEMITTAGGREGGLFPEPAVNSEGGGHCVLRLLH